jgi:site-specific recombinase XerD
MSRHRGLSSATLEHYARPLRELVQELGEDPQRYEPQDLRRFLLGYHDRHGGRSSQQVVSAVRVFLRYLAAAGRAKPGLDAAIPPVANWRLSSLPGYLKAEEVERVLVACDRANPTGLRDRVVLLLLARLGLRATDIWKLRLSDIDARAGTLRLSGKGRREARLPFPADIGDALVLYLERGRPRSAYRDLFLTVRPPVRPYPSSRFVTAIAAEYIRRAGLKAPSFGAHVLRHSAATEMLRQGASLEEIGAVLRHRSIATTQIYAKVDVALLQMFRPALGWVDLGGVVPR